MTDKPNDQTEPPSTGRPADRVVSAVVALAALGGAGYLAKAGFDIASATTASTLIRDHAPALLGLPVLVSLATALVCGARALDNRSQVEILGLRVDGAGAILLISVVVFSALVAALRALW